MSTRAAGGQTGDLSRTQTLPPPRDAFALALKALRRRLRQGVDAPGAPLPIHLIAAELRLSTTPVREALSRLAGEELVDKSGHAYTRPRLDPPSLAELYNLRLLYIAAALSPEAQRRSRRGPWPARPLFSFSAQLADPAMAPSQVVEALFLELVLRANDLALAVAFQRTAARLAPFASIETRLEDSPAAEALGLVAAFETGEAKALRAATRQYHRRRIEAAATIVRLAEDRKYPPDIF